MSSTPAPPSSPGLEHRRVKDAVRERLFGAPATPVRIGRFVVLERLGMGGMGVVYSAYDDALGRKVAIKLVRQDRAEGKARDRLRREAQAVARLSHPNVVQVFEVGTHDAQVYVAMEFVEGTTLREWVAVAPRTWREIRDVFVEAAQGLAVAHDAGLVHRDFKPDNVVVGSKDGPGRVKVLDFGLAAAGGPSEAPALVVAPGVALAAAGTSSTPPASLVAPREAPASSHPSDLAAPSPSLVAPREAPASADGRSPLAAPREALTATGDLLGTPGFMAPEQHLRGHVDARSDQYSFCLSLAEAWLGVRPFATPEGGVDLDAMREERWTDPTKLAALPSSMQRLLRRGLSFDPERRFPDMHALRAALRDDPRIRRRRLATVLASLVLGAGAVTYAMLRTPPTSSCAPAPTRIEEVWTDARQDQVRNAVLAAAPAMSLETWNESVAQVDRHLTEWSRMHTATCERERTTEAREEALRTRLCLESNLRTLGGLLHRLERGDPATVAFLPGNLEKLPSARLCADPNRARELARRDEMLKTPLPSAAEGQIVSTFENGMRARFGAGWRWFADLPDAVDHAPELTLVSPGAQGSSRALRVTGSLRASSGVQHWSGAIYYPGALPGVAVNFTAIRAVHFWARGTPGTFALAVYTQHGGTKPTSTTFEVSPEWQAYSIHLESVEPQRYDVTGLFFGASTPGFYVLELDDVRIESP